MEIADITLVKGSLKSKVTALLLSRATFKKGSIMAKTQSGIPEMFKTEVAAKAQELIDIVLKPRYVKSSSDNLQHNYVTDIYGKWYRDSFYFYAKYCVVHTNALEPSFEWKFARMRFVGNRRFHLAFMRYTGREWVPLYPDPIDQTIDECLTAIRDELYFELV